MKKKRTVLHILHGTARILLFAAAGSAIVMLLWNAIIPAVIGWGSLNFWQAAGLLILCRILFGHFGHGRFFHHPGRFGEMHKMREQMHEETRGMPWNEKREFIRRRMAEFHHQMPHE